MARARSTSAIPASSATVSPFAAKATSVAAICASLASSASIASRSSPASRRVRFSRLSKRVKYWRRTVLTIGSRGLDLCLTAISCEVVDSLQNRGAFSSRRRQSFDYSVHFLHGVTSARLMRTGLAGFSPSAGALLMASATSMPFVTLPNAENFPSK